MCAEGTRGLRKRRGLQRVRRVLSKEGLGELVLVSLRLNVEHFPNPPGLSFLLMCDVEK